MLVHLTEETKCSFYSFIGSLTQKGWGWKTPLKVIWSKPSAQAGSSRVSYTMSKCPWMSSMMETLQSLWPIGTSAVIFRIEKCFLMFRWHPQYLSFCPLLLSLVTTKKSLDPSSLHPPSGINIYIGLYYITDPLNLLFSRMNSPNSHSISS